MGFLMLGVVILIFCALYVAAVVHFNRRVRPYAGLLVPKTTQADVPKATSTLRVLTWNIGYAGLGKNADFFVDKGKSLRALSANDITSAAHDIAGHLATSTADVICLQENANAGFLTRGVPVRGIIQARLANCLTLFWTDMKSVLVPGFLRIEHGMSVHARVALHGCSTVTLPQDDSSFFGGLKKHYGGVMCRIAIGDTGRDWVVFNIHLSAFDPDAQTRLGQLQEVMRLAQHEYDQGHFVVLGGDWNMRLTPTEFAHTTNVDDLFWLTDIPQDALPTGWKIATDPMTPTVRTLNAPYVAGQNYTTIIDGFVCSPNVAVSGISTADLGFQHTDHHPVTVVFNALP